MPPPPRAVVCLLHQNLVRVALVEAAASGRAGDATRFRVAGVRGGQRAGQRGQRAGQCLAGGPRAARTPRRTRALGRVGGRLEGRPGGWLLLGGVRRRRALVLSGPAASSAVRRRAYESTYMSAITIHLMPEHHALDPVQESLWRPARLLQASMDADIARIHSEQQIAVSSRASSWSCSGSMPADPYHHGTGRVSPRTVSALSRKVAAMRRAGWVQTVAGRTHTPRR